ncbi:MAG: deoxyribose-phosphate aldolase [Candidatus Obscuribacterales bacterium]|jgi:deoxyribose-phosphate aldolase|nr:deoxyribose-phosphate aldolase [Candidatus Obscuribacterales bacterium]
MSSEIAKYIDHTNLNPAATIKDIEQLCQEAAEHGFFAVCVNPYYVRHAVKALSSTKVAVASVIGFPLGQNLTDLKIAETQRAISEGAEEIDMVINIGALKDKQIDYVRDEIRAIVKVARDQIVKVIIECDLLTNQEKVAATRATADAGAAFVKTSTGFVKDGIGATVEDVRLMKETLGSDKVAIKASAGIRDYAKAKSLIDAGATRLGTSAGVAIVQGATAKAGGY